MTGGERAIRWGLILSLTVVTLIAIGVSYGHLYKLATSHGEEGLAAAVLPVTVDGLILACSLVIVTAARRGDRSPVLAWLMLLAGIGATLAGNVAHGLEHELAGALVAGWPAVVAAGCFHLVIGEMRKGRETTAVPVPEVEAEPVAEPWDESRPVGMEHWDAIETGHPAIEGPVTGNPGLVWLSKETGHGPPRDDATGTSNAAAVSVEERSPVLVTSTGHGASPEKTTGPEPVVTGTSHEATRDDDRYRDAETTPETGTGTDDREDAAAGVTAIGDRSRRRQPVPATSKAQAGVTGHAQRYRAATDHDGDAATDVGTDRDLDEVIATAREHFAEEIAAGKVPSQNAIRSEIRVGHRRAQQVKEALSKSA